MQAGPTQFNRKMLFDQQKLILVLDNTTYHPESMMYSISQMKVVFLPKTTTSRRDVGII